MRRPGHTAELGSDSLIPMNERDAIFFTDVVQIEFVRGKAEFDLEQCWKIPLSLQAFGRLLRENFTRVKSYLDFVDFEDCKRWYLDEGLRTSRSWLRELGLSLKVEEIDLAELDAPCQFLLFTHLRFLTRTAERIVTAMPEIERFYVVQAKDRLAHEFYFDSDVSAAAICSVCERLGRRVEIIEMEQRPRYMYPHYRSRPLVEAGLDGFKNTSFEGSRAGRIGFAPSTVADAGSIFESLREASKQTSVFLSAWAPGLSFGQGAEFRLSAADGPWSERISGRLAKLFEEFRRRRVRSSLPEPIIQNNRLDFQFEYIIRLRWLAYANMIHHGKQLVREVPLDVFVHSDHFTAEAAVLSRLFRKQGTKILIALHSEYPCDRNWACWDRSDRAIAPCKSAAARLRQISAMQEIFVTGKPAVRCFRSLRTTRSPEDLLACKKAAVGDRKILLVITNALELDCVPFVDLKVHFEAMSVVKSVAELLKERAATVLRTKPGWFAEDPILYEQISRFTAEHFAFLAEANFSESIQMADCVVGVNVPTTGYYEILRDGPPLIHFQTADVVARHPDLPAEAITTISNPEALRPAIEAALFDSKFREKVVRTQRRYAASDFASDYAATADPIRSIVERLIERPLSRRWRLFRKNADAGRRLAELRHDEARSAPETPLDLTSLPVSTAGNAGSVDDILYAPNGQGWVSGWAADVNAGEAAKAVHLFVNECWLTKGAPAHARPDVVAVYRKESLERTGYSVAFRLQQIELVRALTVYAELQDGTFHLLSKSFEFR